MFPPSDRETIWPTNSISTQHVREGLGYQLATLAPEARAHLVSANLNRANSANGGSGKSRRYAWEPARTASSV